MYLIIIPRSINVDNANFGTCDIVKTADNRDYERFDDVEAAKKYAVQKNLSPSHLIVKMEG